MWLKIQSNTGDISAVAQCGIKEQGCCGISNQKFMMSRCIAEYLHPCKPGVALNWSSSINIQSLEPFASNTWNESSLMESCLLLAYSNQQRSTGLDTQPASKPNSSEIKWTGLLAPRSNQVSTAATAVCSAPLCLDHSVKVTQDCQQYTQHSHYTTSEPKIRGDSRHIGHHH